MVWTTESWYLYNCFYSLFDLYIFHLFNQISHSKTPHLLLFFFFFSLSYLFLSWWVQNTDKIHCFKSKSLLCFLPWLFHLYSSTWNFVPSLKSTWYLSFFFSSKLMDFWSSVISVLVSVFQHHSSNLAIGSIEWLITNNIAVQETVFSKIKISPVQIRFNFHSQSHIGSNNVFQELLRVTVEVRKNHYLEKKNTEFMVSEKYFGCAVTFIFI